MVLIIHSLIAFRDWLCTAAWTLILLSHNQLYHDRIGFRQMSFYQRMEALTAFALYPAASNCASELLFHCPTDWTLAASTWMIQF
jgi:hypothetical protein